MTLDQARALDAADPLAFARDRFRLPQGIIYLAGNSLGALPATAPARLAEAVEREWGDDLIASWNKHGWIDAPHRVAALLAPIVGARPNELLIADSTSICLFKLLGAAAAARPGRSVLLTEDGNFPTDRYVALGLAALVPGLEVRPVPGDEIAGAIDGDTAAVFLTQVDYRSGKRHDMRSINEAADAAGALGIWDLSHSAGALDVDLGGDGCDLAVGCGYKYLNGGPGAPAWLFVAERLQGALASPVPGWMGHAEPFAFEDGFRPAPGIARFLTGTPSIVALAALEAGLQAFAGVTVTALEAKARRLTDLFVAALEQRCGDQVALASPRCAAARGSHVSFAHPHSYAAIQALIERGVVGDFRAPNLMRFGFAPLYNSYCEAWLAADALADVLARREWDSPRFHARQKVT